MSAPWDRKTPVPIPAPADRAALTGLDDDTFTDLIRYHLVPRSQDPAARELWTRMWDTLNLDDELNDRTQDVLDGFISAIHEALDDPTLDETTRKRVNKFRTQVGDARQRVRRPDYADLRAAGLDMSMFNPPARKLIALLVDTIEEHHRDLRESGRPQRPADQQLWTALDSTLATARDGQSMQMEPEPDYADLRAAGLNTDMFGAQGCRVIAPLLAAIIAHRRDVRVGRRRPAEADMRLWTILRRAGLQTPGTRR